MTGSVVSSVTRFGLDEPFHFQVGRGQITGHTVVNINGFQVAVPDDGNFYPLWENTTAYVFPSSAITMVMKSSASGDTAVTVRISGLDINFNPISEVVALNGTTGVNTVNQYYRVNALTSVTGNATGTVTLTDTGAANTYAQINPGLGRSQMTVYTVPANRTFYLQRIECWTGSCELGAQYVQYRLQSTAPGASTLTTAQIGFFQFISVTRVQPSGYVAGTDIIFEFATAVTSSGSQATQEVAAYVEGVLVTNDGQLA